MTYRVHVFISTFHGWLRTLLNSLIAYGLNPTSRCTTSTSLFSFQVGRGPRSHISEAHHTTESYCPAPWTRACLCLLYANSKALLRASPAALSFHSPEAIASAWRAMIPRSCLGVQDTQAACLHTWLTFQSEPSLREWRVDDLKISRRTQNGQRDQETHLNSNIRMFCVCHGGCLQNHLCWRLWTPDWLRKRTEGSF